MTDEIGYADAMRELDDILEELERDDLDVDVLATRVQRASELIQLCRGRIARAQADVDRVVTDLESFDATPTERSGVPRSRAGRVGDARTVEGQAFWPASLRFLNCAFT